MTGLGFGGGIDTVTTLGSEKPTFEATLGVEPAERGEQRLISAAAGWNCNCKLEGLVTAAIVTGCVNRCGLSCSYANVLMRTQSHSAYINVLPHSVPCLHFGCRIDRGQREGACRWPCASGRPRTSSPPAGTHTGSTRQACILLRGLASQSCTDHTPGSRQRW